MIRPAVLFTFLIYLISCSSSDQGSIQSASLIKAVKVSSNNKTAHKDLIKAFSAFRTNLIEHQLITAAEEEKHKMVAAYLPDSTESPGFELHMREIGQIDTFHLMFHEYFDLYDDWSKTYLTIFNPMGNAKESLRLWEVSFEGNISINVINKSIIEIAYHDFFKKNTLKEKAILPDDHLYLKASTVEQKNIEGTIYEYFKVDHNGRLNKLSQKTSVSPYRDFPQSSAKLLSKTELDQFSIDEVRLMRDEILAGHGYIFSNNQKQDYFDLQEWYIGLHENVDSLLSDIEHLNYNLLSKVEQEY